MSDYDRIWLEPACCADPETGRTWADEPRPADPCEHDAPWTEYVRADIPAAEIAALSAALRTFESYGCPLFGDMSSCIVAPNLHLGSVPTGCRQGVARGRLGERSVVR